MQTITAALALSLSALAIGPAWADSKVTLCATDRQTGAGTNLATAIQAGGLITFDCNGPATVQMSASHPIERDVVIDGGGMVTLLEGNAPMFVARRQGVSLELRGLKFRDAKRIIVEHSVAASARVTISGSTFSNCEAPFSVLRSGPLVIRDSVFTNSTAPVGTSAGLTIERSKFEGTRGIAAFSFGEITKITDSVFSRNSSGALLIGLGGTSDRHQSVEILRSTFSSNGGDEK